jgi:hypothetical protein
MYPVMVAICHALGDESPAPALPNMRSFSTDIHKFLALVLEVAVRSIVRIPGVLIASLLLDIRFLSDSGVSNERV